MPTDQEILQATLELPHFVISCFDPDRRSTVSGMPNSSAYDATLSKMMSNWSSCGATSNILRGHWCTSLSSGSVHFMRIHSHQISTAIAELLPHLLAAAQYSRL